jgi:putative transposase
MKKRNPSWGCPRIAQQITQQITLAFGMAIDRDVVRRILATRYEPKPDSGGPSWLTVLGHAKDSLWSRGSVSVRIGRPPRAYWVLVVIDHGTRRIVGFGVHRGVVDGVALCRMFNRASSGQALPAYLSADHDPLYRFNQWQANLRIRNIQDIKTVPYVPRSHPVVERLIGTVRRECLDRLLFWTAADRERKLVELQQYYSEHRTHARRAGHPSAPSLDTTDARASLRTNRWQPHGRGLYHTPKAA